MFEKILIKTFQILVHKYFLHFLRQNFAHNVWKITMIRHYKNRTCEVYKIFGLCFETKSIEIHLYLLLSLIYFT